jgi:hypothetical protein
MYVAFTINTRTLSGQTRASFSDGFTACPPPAPATRRWEYFTGNIIEKVDGHEGLPYIVIKTDSAPAKEVRHERQMGKEACLQHSVRQM